jgi:hypothetical protein
VKFFITMTSGQFEIPLIEGGHSIGSELIPVDKASQVNVTDEIV